jgi:hypothetical protein
LPTSVAPFQKFRYIDYPSACVAGTYAYTVTPMYFVDATGTALVAGDAATVEVTLGGAPAVNVAVGFTRGFTSSQAYAREFGNAAFRPANQSTYLFNTAPFEKQYAWCGRSARAMLFSFFDGFAATDTLDAFVYDVDEPDFVEALHSFGPRLRLFLDDSKEGSKVKPDREGCANALAASGAAIRRGHFRRFAHDKVLVRKDAQGTPISVLCGSANYSIRGLYVQSNSIIVVTQADLAAKYARVFDLAFAAGPGGEWAAVTHDAISQSWAQYRQSDLPECAVSFAPHTNGELGLNPVAKALQRAQKNVVFALMSSGGGNAQKQLAATIKADTVYAVGTVQTEAFATQLSASGQDVTSYANLGETVPEPFYSELNVGQGGKPGYGGQVIHHKFVVVDFNGTQPTVFCGSSNLALGGEQQNGDNLMAFYDASIATAYAIEGFQLADHYSFRDKMRGATQTQPFTLWQPSDTSRPPWYADYYTAGTKHFREMAALTG